MGGSGSVVSTMALEHTSDIVRLLLKTKVRSIDKFSVIFRKMDKDGNGALSRKQFKQLIHLAVKGNKELVERLNLYLEALWVDVCDDAVEVELNTAAKWLFRLSCFVQLTVPSKVLVTSKIIIYMNKILLDSYFSKKIVQVCFRVSLVYHHGTG